VLGLALYTGILLAAGMIRRLVEIFKIPFAPLLIVLGLILGRSGFQIIPAKTLPALLPGVELHLALLLGVLGYRLGKGLLRLPTGTIAKRSLPPLALAAAALLISALALPHLLPDPSAKKSFLRFYLPQAFVLAVYPLLALRDLRGRPPADVGSLFLVAILLVGAVHSFTPPLLWSRDLDPGVLWRGPVLILGESGALGVICAIAFLLLTRTFRCPRMAAALATLAALAAVSWRYELWLPFAGLGYGIALGRTHESPWRIPEWILSLVFSEASFLLLVAIAFAPALFFESVILAAVVNAIWLAAILFSVRAWNPRGKELVTGPGLLFLGLTLAVRLDNRMSPITRSTIDLALPAWIVLRSALHLAQRRRSSREHPRRTASRRILPRP
jgi:hypothetical protein